MLIIIKIIILLTLKNASENTFPPLDLDLIGQFDVSSYLWSDRAFMGANYVFFTTILQQYSFFFFGNFCTFSAVNIKLSLALWDKAFLL